MLSIKQANKLSVVNYLLSRGIDLLFTGKNYICSSPFATDTTWSFTVYPANTYYCWSTGNWGSFLDLVRYFEGGLTLPEALYFVEHNLIGSIPEHDIERDFKTSITGHNQTSYFNYRNYINTDREEVESIYRYGASRGITDGFLPGVYNTCLYTADGVRSFTRHPALMFLHTDLNNNICGAKFRNIDPNDSRRFTARGDLGFYILNNDCLETFKKRVLWLVESETSANSLWMFFRDQRTPGTVVSMGGVSTPPKELPAIHNIKVRNIIIDYDGNEQLYQERIAKYEHLNCKPIKMILPKGEDLNSLYVTGRMYLVEHLLNN